MSSPIPPPEEIFRLSVESVDRLVDRLEREVPKHPAFASIDGKRPQRALLFGDSHGDYRSVQEVVRRFEAESERTLLIGLGDYVDRTPGGLPHGSAINALFVLSVAAQYPDRTYLLQGNHETARRIGVLPRTLPDDIAGLWGESAERYARIEALLERGPYGAATESGAYLAHAGFPRGPLPHPWTDAFARVDDDRLCELVWAECGASVIRRGVTPAFSEGELERFLSESGLSVFLRGHDPDLTGRPVFSNRCLTLHTTSVYERYGGILMAWAPLDRKIHDLSDVRVEHLSTERARPPGIQ